MIGQNDLVEDTFWGEAIIAPGLFPSKAISYISYKVYLFDKNWYVTETLKGKTYELTCAIGKTGNADAEFDAEVVNDIDQATENINTEFEMRTYWQNVRIFMPGQLWSF